MSNEVLEEDNQEKKYFVETKTTLSVFPFNDPTYFPPKKSKHKIYAEQITIDPSTTYTMINRTISGSTAFLVHKLYYTADDTDSVSHQIFFDGNSFPDGDNNNYLLSEGILWATPTNKFVIYPMKPLFTSLKWVVTNNSTNSNKVSVFVEGFEISRRDISIDDYYY